MKTLRISTAAIALSALLLAPVAFAKEGASMGDEMQSEHAASTSQMMHGSDDATSAGEDASSTESHGEEHMSATSSTMRGEGESGEHNMNGEAHRSDVANIVHQLLQDADREGGIGEEVRAVATEQASSSEASAKAMDTLDSESGVKKFFLGPDYQSLGELRSSIVTTHNAIHRLQTARERATLPAVQSDLDAQIAALKDVASSTQAYVDSHAEGFSLFGWLVRLVSSS